MKKRYIIILCLAASMIFASCSGDKENKERSRDEEETASTEVTTSETGEEEEKETKDDKKHLDLEPEEVQIRSICQLATLECYYNNVAKGHKDSGSGLAHIGEKERTFWVEYSAVVTLGVDISEVSMLIDGDVIYVYLPEAKILKPAVVNEESYNMDSIVENLDNNLNKNEITATDITSSVNNSLEDLNKKVAGDKTLLNNARERAKTLIKSYVDKLGETSGKNYKVVFRDAKEKNA